MEKSSAHWLSVGGATHTPKSLIFFDTETSETSHKGYKTEKLKCWDAIHRRRGLKGLQTTSKTYHSGEDAISLANLVEDVAEVDKETWVIAHNVGFDLSVTSLPFMLFNRGWKLGSFHLGEDSSYWTMSRNKKSIVIVDSWSWVRCALGDIAKDVGRRKAKLPTDKDPLDIWHKRSRVDVEILDEMMVTILDWWDKEQLGRFAVTGAACGWRTLRKKVPAQKILVGRDGERTDFEREAVFGGRREVYGVGIFHDNWMGDFDFSSAYLTTLAAFKMPSRPIPKWTTDDELLFEESPETRDYIARVEITTSVPCAPVRVAKEVWWPVGTFRTVLTGPEVRYAMTLADDIRVIDWQGYRMTSDLSNWAVWALTLFTKSDAEVPHVVKRVIKNWGRSVPGRFAGRSSRVVSTGPSLHMGWHMETGHNLDTGRVVEILSIDGVQKTIEKDIDANDVFPAVLAFVEGHTRVALGQMMGSRRPESLLQCNTDGWWESRAARSNDYTPENIPWPYMVVRKALERRLEIRGPNHLMTPHETRYSGIPSSSVNDEDGGMHWNEWPSLKWQLINGKTGEYRRPERTAHLAIHYVKRWVLSTGETIPITTRVNDEGDTLILPWSQTWGRRRGDELDTYQVEALSALLRRDPAKMIRHVQPLPTQPGRDLLVTPYRGGTRSLAQEARRLKVPISDLCAMPYLGVF